MARAKAYAPKLILSALVCIPLFAANVAIAASDGYCGDDNVDASLGEQCDDGNRKPGDGCNSECKNEYCGDGIVTFALEEECEDGNKSNGDGCNSKCEFEYCGDNVTQNSSEQCDDGNVINGDGCDWNCQDEEVVDCSPIVCGDDREFPKCDAGDNPINYTVDPCLISNEPDCGNQQIESGEQCDDGNTSNNDGCNLSCEVEEGWLCENICNPTIAQNSDDGIAQLFKNIIASIFPFFAAEANSAGDNCISVCGTICLDGLTRGDEQCDDGNLIDDDDCNNNCESNHSSAPECGNGVIESDNDEDCDDGDDNSDTVADACRTNCKKPACGDSVVDSNEQCEIGDDADCGAGKICNDSCMCEAVHSAAPGVCGNGTQEDGEECDDGNIYNQDGCNNDCEEDVALVSLTGICEPCSKCDEESAGCYVHTDPNMTPITSSPVCLQDPSNYFATTYPWHECRKTPVHGNGKLEGMEECDDGNTEGGDGCSSAGKREASYYCRYCEGVSCSGDEVCSVNKTSFTNGGNPTCRRESSMGNTYVACKACGNGEIDPGEECDDGNRNDRDECTNSCKDAVCGDGIVWNGEEWCDDGNTNDGDSCGSTCQDCPCDPVCSGDNVCYVSLTGKDPYCDESTPTGNVTGGYWDICTPAPPQNSIEVKVEKVKVLALDRGRYSFSVKNVGSKPVYGLSLYMPWPSGLTHMSNSSGCRRTDDNKGVICHEAGKILQPNTMIIGWVLFSPSGNVCPKINYSITAEARVDNDVYQSNSLSDWMWCTQSMPECGNKKVEEGEECDDGNKNNGDGCSSICKTESSDDSTCERCTTISPQCPSNKSCYVPSDSDKPISCAVPGIDLSGYTNPSYIECPYDGNGNDPVCGNGKTESGEQCDDNNVINGDGCDSNCQTEQPVVGNCSACEDYSCPSGQVCYQNKSNDSPTCAPSGIVQSTHTECGARQCTSVNDCPSAGCSSKCSIISGKCQRSCPVSSCDNGVCKMEDQLQLCNPSQCGNGGSCDPAKWTCDGNVSIPPCNSSSKAVNCAVTGKVCNPPTGLCVNNDYYVQTCMLQGNNTYPCTQCLEDACFDKTAQAAINMCGSQCGSNSVGSYAACVAQGNGRSASCKSCLNSLCNTNNASTAYNLCKSSCGQPVGGGDPFDACAFCAQKNVSCLGNNSCYANPTDNIATCANSTITPPSGWSKCEK
ncbi:MAG: DUF4215 domain-containing protein [Kiritimatiellales bacterium]|nr:DUF4215 domain-containing protein [Kiritimatiellales bacterium]